MKLMLYHMENSEIELEDGYAFSVECADRVYFRKLVSAARGQESSDMAVLDDKFERIDLGDSALTIIDPFSLSVYMRPLMNKTFKTLEKYHSCDEDIAALLDSLERQVAYFVDVVTEDIPADLICTPPRMLTDYLKLADTALLLSGDPCADLCSMIALTSFSRLYDMIVLVNIKSYFSFDETDALINTCVSCGQKLLLLDDRISTERHKNEKKLLIDEDLYDIII